MNIEYVGRNLQIDDSIRSFAESKLPKITKFLDEPIDVRLTLEQEKHRQIADLHVAHRHGVLQAREENSQILDAINLVVEKAGKQARRAKSKHVDKVRRTERVDTESPPWPVEIIRQDSIADDSPHVIDRMEMQIKPMSIEEAASELDGCEHDFVIFRETASGRVNVLYRRKRDDHYGLIRPAM